MTDGLGEINKIQLELKRVAGTMHIASKGYPFITPLPFMQHFTETATTERTQLANTLFHPTFESETVNLQLQALERIITNGNSQTAFEILEKQNKAFIFFIRCIIKGMTSARYLYCTRHFYFMQRTLLMRLGGIAADYPWPLITLYFIVCGLANLISHYQLAEDPNEQILKHEEIDTDSIAQIVFKYALDPTDDLISNNLISSIQDVMPTNDRKQINSIAMKVKETCNITYKILKTTPESLIQYFQNADTDKTPNDHIKGWVENTFPSSDKEKIFFEIKSIPQAARQQLIKQMSNLPKAVKQQLQELLKQAKDAVPGRISAMVYAWAWLTNKHVFLQRIHAIRILTPSYRAT